MAKHKSNGHANGQATNGFARAPAGGIRAGGKWYPGGARMPERYRRLARADGDESSGDPSAGIPLTAPNFGRVALPHAMTFIGKQSTISHVYRNPDEAVRRSGGQAWKMRRDPSIMECLEARQRATALLGWHLEVEDEKDPRQKQLQDEMTKVLRRTHQFTEYRRVLLEAIWYGRYAVEHRYGFETIDGKRRTVIKGWVPINGDKLVFRFDDGSGEYRDDEVGVRVAPVYNQEDRLAGDRHLEMTDQGMAYFLEPWERSLFAIHRHIIEDGDYEDPISAGRIHGVGVRDRIYWCWYQKQETMAQLMEVIDRTGSGVTIYWYPAGDHTAKSEVEDMAERQRNENVLIMPRMSGDPAMDAYGIERIEPTTAGIQAMQQVVDEFFGDQIMRYINGGTLFSKSKSLGIGGGGADIQEHSFYLIVQYDSVKLEETITQEMLLPLKRFNCPWADDIALWFKIDTDSPDSQEKLQAAKTLWEMGAKIKTAEVMGKVGLSMPAEDDEVLQNPSAMQPMGMPGAMPGQPGTEGQAGAAAEGSLQDLFGPLAGELDGDEGPGEGAPGGGQLPLGPPGSGGPEKYAKDWGGALQTAIADTDHSATIAQKEAGNYAKGKFSWNGLTISIENPAGTKRRPEWKALVHHYGYINRTEGSDGDAVDVFVGPRLESDLIVIVDQCTEDGRFDEHKCLIGFNNLDDATEGYLANYDDGWMLGPATALTVEQFKNWLADGDTTKPIEEQVSRYAKRQIRSSPGQQPLPSLGDVNSKQNHLWKETLHPRNAKGEWIEKTGAALPHQFGQGMLFREMAAKLQAAENHPDPQAGQAQQQELYNFLAGSDIPPEQLAALVSGDEDQMRALEKQAIATGRHEHSPQPTGTGAEWLQGVEEAKAHRDGMSAQLDIDDDGQHALALEARQRASSRKANSRMLPDEETQQKWRDKVAAETVENEIPAAVPLHERTRADVTADIVRAVQADLEQGKQVPISGPWKAHWLSNPSQVRLNPTSPQGVDVLLGRRGASKWQPLDREAIAHWAKVKGLPSPLDHTIAVSQAKNEAPPPEQSTEMVADYPERPSWAMQESYDIPDEHRQQWDNPGLIRRGDFLELESHQTGKIYTAVAIGHERSGKVLTRNEHGIQKVDPVTKVVNRWEGGALAAGPKAHQYDPRLLQARKPTATASGGEPEGSSSWPLYDQSEDDAVRADVAAAKAKPATPKKRK